MPDKFHDKAKDSGNKLKANILSFSSVATGVFFFTLTGKDVSGFSLLEKIMLIGAMSFFAITVSLCLIELYIDSQRFFSIAKQMEKPEGDRDWSRSKSLKKIRVRLIKGSYISVIVGFVLTFLYMVHRIA